MRRFLRFLLPLVAVGVLLAPFSLRAADDLDAVTGDDGIYAVLQTDMGTIVCRLLWRDVPLTVANFVGLAEGTRSFLDGETGETVERPFYEDLLFHRVIQGFMIQTGDPTGKGDGGPGYRFNNEIDPELKHDRPGTMSMANMGPGTNGSQFFITERAAPWLDGKNPVFGRVVSGMDVVEAISAVPTDKDRPVEPVHLQSVKIIRRGRDARHFDAEATFARMKDLSEEQLTELRSERFMARMEKLEKKSHRAKDGSRYVVVRKGKGDKPRPGEAIQVHYVCYLPDGKVVETTRRSPRPLTLTAGEPRRGLDWERQYLQMKPHELRWVFLPPELAFGHRGIPGVVPPDSPLVLQLELVGVSKGED